VSPCGSGVAGLVVQTLGVTTRVGNVPIGDFFSTFDPWPNDYWRIVPFGDTIDNVDVEAEGGDLFITPQLVIQNATLGRYRGVFWIDTLTGGEQGFYSLQESEVYFRLLPMINPTGSPYTWLSSFQLYDFGESGSPEPSPTPFAFLLLQISSGAPPTISFTAGDGITNWSDSLPYDSIEHYWFRMRHELSTDLVYVETAPEACGSWTLIGTAGPFTTRITSFTIELFQETFLDADNLASTGYMGALNQQSVERTLPLLTRIGDFRVLGLVGAELPLITEVGVS
jgi:hypothetical protein